MTLTVEQIAGSSRPARGRELVPLMRAIAGGDKDALSSLYRKTSAKLFGICSRVLSSQAEAEEVLQEVYLSVWQNAARYDQDKASPITWLAVMARNRAIDRLRKRERPAAPLEIAEQIADGAATALELLERAQENDRLSKCLDELDDRQRAMIRSAFLDGATYPQLAERESVPLGTMKSWIRRGLLRLRGCLER